MYKILGAMSIITLSGFSVLAQEVAQPDPIPQPPPISIPQPVDDPIPIDYASKPVKKLRKLLYA